MGTNKRSLNDWLAFCLNHWPDFVVLLFVGLLVLAVRSYVLAYPPSWWPASQTAASPVATPTPAPFVLPLEVTGIAGNSAAINGAGIRPGDLVSLVLVVGGQTATPSPTATLASTGTPAASGTPASTGTSVPNGTPISVVSFPNLKVLDELDANGRPTGFTGVPPVTLLLEVGPDQRDALLAALQEKEAMYVEDQGHATIQTSPTAPSAAPCPTALTSTPGHTAPAAPS